MSSQAPPSLWLRPAITRRRPIPPAHHVLRRPWARGHGLARKLIQAVETTARETGYRVLNLDVRETQRAAIALYKALGFQHWGTHPLYAIVRGQSLAGHFFYKDLTSSDLPAAVQPLTEAQP